ncbi:MAG: sulfate adenylyltransferase [Acidobacteria bacterium]|nr:sulfate adenylyltransferase [Acidobacteriota bacterium]
MGTFTTIAPHGGSLVNRQVREEDREARREQAARLKRLELGLREVSDLMLLGVGGFSPLEGFLTSADYHSVVREGRLASGLPWTIPIILPVSADVAAAVRLGDEIGLWTLGNHLLGTLEVRDKFRYDKEEQARKVFGTTDRHHPAVDYLHNCGEVLVGGPISLLDLPPVDPCYESFLLHPRETRYLFQQKGWRTVVGFQTRNPVHRAHEYIQKCALETVDGLLLHPLVGETKSDDIPGPVRMECYRALMDHYYPRDRVVLSVFPAAMRYAGPREAIFHAVVRKNYGCTHFIVGRDHAGVGNFYGPYDAQRIFERYTPDELAITPMFFDFTFYCRRCAHIVSEKTCRHDEDDRIFFSGTRVRELLARGQSLPEEFTRPEIARILAAASRRHEL